MREEKRLFEGLKVTEVAEVVRGNFNDAGGAFVGVGSF